MSTYKKPERLTAIQFAERHLRNELLAAMHPAYAFLAALGYRHRTDKACARTLGVLYSGMEILQPDSEGDARKANDLANALYMMIREELEGAKPK